MTISVNINKKTPAMVEQVTISIGDLPQDHLLFLRGCLDRILAIYKLFGFDDKGYSDKNTYLHWKMCVQTSKVHPIKFVKWKLSNFYASLVPSTIKQVLTSEKLFDNLDKAPTVLLGGRAYKFVRRMKRDNEKLFLNFITTFNYAKKGMPRPGKDLMDLAEIDAFKKLTTESTFKKPISLTRWSDINDLKYNSIRASKSVLSRESFKKELIRTVHEIYGKKFDKSGNDISKKFLYSQRIKPFFPSTSANYINSRKKGGVIGMLMDTVIDDINTRSLLDVEPFFITDEKSENYTVDNEQRNKNIRYNMENLKKGIYTESVISPTTYSNGSIVSPFEPGLITKTFGSEDRKTKLIDINRGTTTQRVRIVIDVNGQEKLISTGTTQVPSLDITKLELKSQLLYHAIEHATIDEEPIAVPLALSEALKVRVISKGPGFLYTFLKPLQKFLWSVLKDHPVFTLIGKPVDAATVQDLVGKVLKENEAFLSVDYSDATNQIESWVSKTIIDEISSILQLSELESFCARQSLIYHHMVLPMKDGSTLKGVQQNGQLMGGILSFPVLCIANATCLRLTKEVADDRLYTLIDSKIGVNGDDGILRTTDYGQKIWERVGAFIGLSPSIGKVYYSKEFLNINSTTFTYNSSGYKPEPLQEGDRQEYFKLVEYVNLGLLYSMKRSGGIATSVSKIEQGDKSFGARCTELIKNTPSTEITVKGVTQSLKERVLGQFLHLNKDKILVDLPYFIPEHLGGLGLPSIGKYGPSDADLRFARKIYENPDLFKLPHRPDGTSWQTWKYASKRFHITSSDLNSSIEEPSMFSMNDICGLACVEAIFTMESLSQIMHEVIGDELSEVKYQRDIQKIWTKARKSGNPPEPFNPKHFPIYQNNNNRPIFLVKKIGPQPNAIEAKLRSSSPYDGSVEKTITLNLYNEPSANSIVRALKKGGSRTISNSDFIDQMMGETRIHDYVLPSF